MDTALRKFVARAQSRLRSLHDPSPELETELRERFIDFNLTRTRASCGVGVALVLWVSLAAALDATLPPQAVLTHYLRLGVVLPGLLTVLAACYVPFLRRHYTLFVCIGIGMAGLGAIYMGVWAVPQGRGYIQTSSVLAIVHATLLVGLRPRVSVVVAVVFIAWHWGASTFYGLPDPHITFVTSVLIATAAICLLSMRSLEIAFRNIYTERRRLREQAYRDGLTGLYNKRHFDEVAQRMWDRAREEGGAVEVILVDIDHFKQYNDAHGHQAGDECLREVASICERHVQREPDFCARFGGEEFALVLYRADTGPREDTAELLRREVAERRIENAGSPLDRMLTVSVGSAFAAPSSGRSLRGLIQRADEALYRAKQRGRNRVVYKDHNGSTSATGSFTLTMERPGK